MMDTRDALVAARKQAVTAADIVKAQTRIEWFNRCEGAEPCPAAAIPTVETLRFWVPEYLDEDEVELEAANIEEKHRTWVGTLEHARPEHPVAPSIKAWLGKVAPNKRETGILPGSFHTPGTVGSAEATSSALVPPLPLLAFGGDRTQHRGAPLAKRIWWSVIANTPLTERKPDGSGSILLATTLRDIGAWLYPGKRGLRRRDLPRLRAALVEADSIRIDWNGQPLQCVRIKARPTKLDELLPFRVRLPPGSDRGPMIQLGILYRCGTVSEPVFDAWIRLAYVWDLAKRNNGGRRVYATRPKVMRDEDRGWLIDESNEVIRGPDPVLPASKRRKVPRARPAVNWRDSRAVRTGTDERSPAADRVPVFNNDGILRLLYGAEARPMTRERVKAARRIIRHQFARTKYVEIEPVGKQGMRLLQPRLRQ